MTTRPHIVYATYDGLLEPLGYSQVVRVVTRLADQGRMRFTICSLEKKADRRDGDREQRLEDQLRRHRVRWRRRTWTDGGPPVALARNIHALGSMLEQVADEQGADLFHARSYVPAAVARRVGARHGIPYLFDTRGFWVDERIENGRFMGGPIGRRAARGWEANLYRDAAGAVMLTDLAADDIRTNPDIPWDDHRPVEVIPTCVDYDQFDITGDGDIGELDGADRRRLSQSLVVGYVGSVKPVYPLEESLRLFDHLLARRPDAHLLCLTRNHQAMHDQIARLNLPDHSFTVTSADHRDMPRWLQVIDWGLLLRATTDDQRAYKAAMPTKLAEFFATGTRPVYCGASGEVRNWIDRAGTGVVLDGWDEQALRDGADHIARSSPSPRRLWKARWRTRSHFGLEGGADRYADVYQRVLKHSDSHRLKVLFLTEGTTVPASRFRVQQLVPHLQQRGIDCTVRSGYGDGYNHWSSTPAAPVYKLACSLQRIPYCLDADRFDVVFIQRPALPFTDIAERLANWRNPHTIFDVDDAIFADADGQPRPRQKQAFEQIVSRCSHVICGNEFLAHHTRDLSPTTVIPTVVDTDVYRPADDGASIQAPSLVVGWMGTASNFDSLAMIAPVLGRLATEIDDLEVHIVSNQRFEPLDGIDDVVQYQWSKRREVEFLQRFDIGLMPLVDNPGTRGKCGFKAIQYMAVGTPVVASPVGVNTDIVADRGGILADSPHQFDQAIRRLADDEQLRREMGRAGRRTVENQYSVQAVIDRYVKLLEAVARRAPVNRTQPADSAERPSASSSPETGRAAGF